ncbi:MAG: ribosomal protein S18-alanine N-acetyltransferase [Clostridia bacterium]|mgnify:CR=1 FL=1|nr:ribosomal protein S18-alanine N-acetyltransferase [Clostridia bacterium]
MTARACTLADVKKLAALEEECFSAPWTEGLLSGTLARADFCGFLIEEKGEVAGYICGGSLFEDAEIARVAVAEKFRRKGLGGKLLETFENEAKARGAKRIFLEVRVSNRPAIGLYTARGFESFHVRKKYYADGEDAVEMKKQL